MSAAAVYRMFDGEGTLLYVGCSVSWPTRLSQHASATPWWEHVRNVTVAPFSSKEEALEAEGAAIVAERPRYNVRARPGSGYFNREAFERLREERRERGEEAERERFLANSYDAEGSVLCTNCARRPERIPTGKRLDELVCMRCRCNSLVLVTDLLPEDVAA